MNEKQSKFQDFFEEQIALCEQRSNRLLADGRGDEATFEKIKGNIYDIFRTVLTVAVKTCTDDTETVGEFFRLRIEQIPLSWEQSYEKAKTHNDVSKMHLEQTKLDVVQQIKEEFTRIWEGV